MTDKNGTILKSTGTGNSLFHTVKSANVGGSIKDVEQDLFSTSLAEEVMGKNEKDAHAVLMAGSGDADDSIPD